MGLSIDRRSEYPAISFYPQLFGSPAPVATTPKSFPCDFLSFPRCPTLGNVRQRDTIVSHDVLAVMLIVSDSEHNVADTVGGDGVARRRLPGLGNARESPGWHRSG